MRGASLVGPELILKRGFLGFNFLLAVLSLRGVPPFLGFLGKLVRLSEILPGNSMFAGLALLMFSGLMLIPYLRLMFRFFTQFSFRSVQRKSFKDQPLWLLLIFPVLYFV